MNEKRIIIAIVIFMIVSFLFLAYNEKKQQDPDYQKDWWAVYFIDPKSNSLSFVIENHGNSPEFHWQILKNKKVAEEGDVNIKKGSSVNIAPDMSANVPDKIDVKISDGKSDKEIYKNFLK